MKKLPSILLTGIVLFLAACGGPAAPTASDEDVVASMVASTLQAFQAQATPTLAASATPLPPTPLPSPTFTPTLPPPTATSTLPPGTRVQFLTGATQVVLSGQVAPGQVIDYVVQASKGQPFMVLLDSPNRDLKLSVIGVDGTFFVSASTFGNWQGVLPTTQDYHIQVSGGAATQTFTLNLTAAARVEFAPGQTRLVVKGSTVGGYPVSYAVYASKGQKMDVILNVPGEKAALTIWGFSDGQPYARAQTGIKDASLNLPLTQDYIIEVVPQAGQVVEYNMTIRVK
ncbi:MAG: hypothetical protein ACOY0R_02995 [Chloroflexota bacterium]